MVELYKATNESESGIKTQILRILEELHSVSPSSKHPDLIPQQLAA
jgi:hypothetical protein